METQQQYEQKLDVLKIAFWHFKWKKNRDKLRDLLILRVFITKQ